MLNVYHRSPLSDFASVGKVADRTVEPRGLCVGRRGETPKHLTLRQMQICELIAEGMSNKQIAARLGLAEGSVKVMVSRDIFIRLGLPNRLAVGLWYKGTERQSVVPPETA